jgi:hypothetical protein
MNERMEKRGEGGGEKFIFILPLEVFVREIENL